MEKKTKIIAYYLPQFHPIPENNKWWGNGFTEWRNVAKAKKYFLGHYQPRIPSDLGFYDLRVAETREQQAKLAKKAGIYGFAYWHYWFEPGKELLQRPFDEVVSTGTPDFPFCLAWANESWYNKSWDKDGSDILLIEQKYLGIEDYTKHFYRVLPAFKDSRYIKVNGKPVFIIYKPQASSEISLFMDTWQKLAKKEGLNGIYFIAHCNDINESIEKDFELGFELVNRVGLGGVFERRSLIHRIIVRLFRTIFKLPLITSYKNASHYFFKQEIDSSENICPSIIAGWDHTPRSGNKGIVLTNETPDLFYKHSLYVLKNTTAPFVFLKSWNEWAEGNYIEPDLRFGTRFIEALNQAIIDSRE